MTIQPLIFTSRKNTKGLKVTRHTALTLSLYELGPQKLYKGLSHRHVGPSSLRATITRVHSKPISITWGPTNFIFWFQMGPATTNQFWGIILGPFGCHNKSTNEWDPRVARVNVMTNQRRGRILLNIFLNSSFVGSKWRASLRYWKIDGAPRIIFWHLVKPHNCLNMTFSPLF